MSEISKGRKGVIRFKGAVGAFGNCYGLELDEAIETGNDGSFDGEQYFECADGKGTFIKRTAIKQKLGSKALPDDDNEEQKEDSFPSSPSAESPSKKTANAKSKDKTKTKTKTKTKGKNNTNNSKSLKNGTTNSRNGKNKSKSKTRSNGSSSSEKKPGKKSKSKTNSKSKLMVKHASQRSNRSSTSFEDFVVPSDSSHIEKLKLIYPKLLNLKFPQKRRMELLTTCSEIVDDEKCEKATIKYAIEGFRKVFVEQLKDKKLALHKKLYAILTLFITKHNKKYKNENLYFLKALMNHIGHLKLTDKKAMNEVDAVINLMLTEVGLSDKKQLIIMLNEFVRAGTSNKNKTIKQKAWAFVHVALTAKTEASDGQKIPSQVFDSMDRGLKNALSSTDKLIQAGSFKVLDLLHSLDEVERVEKLFGRMSATAQKAYHKRYAQSTPAWFTDASGGSKPRSPSPSNSKRKKPNRSRVSVGALQIGDVSQNVNFLKRDSLEDSMLSKTKNKAKAKGKAKGKAKSAKKATSEKSAKSAGKKRSQNTGSARLKNGVKDKSKTSDKSKGKGKGKGKQKGGEKSNGGKKGETKSKGRGKANGSKSGKGKKKSTEDESERHGDLEQDDNAEDDEEDILAVRGLKKNSHQRSKKNVISDDGGGDLGDLNLTDLFGAGDGDEELPSLPVTSSGEEEAADLGDGIIASTPVLEHAQSSSTAEKDDDFADFPYGLLSEDSSGITWKMLDYLQTDNRAHELLSVLSRMGEFMVYAEKLPKIDYAKSIPDTRPLSSEDEKEIEATQLSYNLMRILSTDVGNTVNESMPPNMNGAGGGGHDAVSQFLQKKCSEVILHSLAVYHEDLSSGNVYHGRVLLEIVLNTWPKSLMSVLTRKQSPKTINSNTSSDVMHHNTQTLFKNALFRNLHQGNLNSFFLDLLCYKPPNPDKYKQMLPLKAKLIMLFREWKFMPYLLRTACSYKTGVDGNDDVATKYCTFFIDLVARSAAIPEVAGLFEGTEHLIIDSFMNGLLDPDKKRTNWHRSFCGQILIQFLDICSRPSIMDPTQLQAAESGLIEPEPSPNVLYPLFDACLKRLHSYIPKLSNLIISYQNADWKTIRLNYGVIKKPFGQIRLQCLELLTISADFAQFECGNVLAKIPMRFWNYLVEMAFMHKNNNIFLCHFRRLLHLTMIFRRRILRHLFVEKKLLDRFIQFYISEKPHTALHGYVLQMIFDIWQHDQEEHDEDEEQHQNEEDDDDDDDDDNEEQTVSQFL